MQDYPADEGEMEEGFELRYNLASALISAGDLETAETQLRIAYGTRPRSEQPTMSLPVFCTPFRCLMQSLVCIRRHRAEGARRERRRG